MNGAVRVLTYNTAAGNPRIATPQEAFLALPFYEEALEGAPGAPILALQEVGGAQARALRRAAAAGRGRVLQARRPGLGNALVVPARYDVVSDRRGWYPLAQLRGAAAALARRGERVDWRQLGEARTWIEARLRDSESGRAFTAIVTHLSVEPALKVEQGRALAHRVRAAAARGPVVVAGDLNLPAHAPRGRDRELAALLGWLDDMAPPAGPPGIDRILAAGFEAVSARTWTAAELRLPGVPAGRRPSDHDPVEALLRFAPRR